MLSNPSGILRKSFKMKFNKIVLGMILIAVTFSCSPQGKPVQGVEELKRNPSVPLVTPIWSPSGDHIAASHIAYTHHRSTIYDFDLTTRKSTVLLSIEGEVVAQSWSRAESYLAVAISQSVTFSDDGIWVFNVADGSNEYRTGRSGGMVT